MNNKALILLGLLIISSIVVMLLIYVPVREQTNEPVAEPDQLSDVQTTIFSDSELELAFSYLVGPEGYVLEERGSPEPKDGLVRTLILTATRELGNVPEGGEGPPTINVQVLDNREAQDPLTWASDHQAYSNSNLMIGSVEETNIGDVSGIRYRADGLYVSENIIVARNEKVYVFSGMFFEEDSKLMRDFEVLLRTVRFDVSE